MRWRSGGYLPPEGQEDYAAELTRFGIETTIVVPGSFTSGTNHFAYFTAYMRSSQADMILEIDEAEKIVFWTISKNVTGGELGCSLNEFG